MNLYTVYNSPSDYPDTYIVRRWEVVPREKEPVAREVFMIEKDLNKIREKLTDMGLYAMPRDKSDDQKIIETWL